MNNAGGAPPGKFADVSPRFLNAVVTLNLVAPMYVAQRANAQMQQQDTGGVIVNIGSVSGMRANAGAAAYAAAKAGVINLTESLAVEFAPKVRVVCVTAGALATAEFYASSATAASPRPWPRPSRSDASAPPRTWSGPSASSRRPMPGSSPARTSSSTVAATTRHQRTDRSRGRATLPAISTSERAGARTPLGHPGSGPADRTRESGRLGSREGETVATGR